MTSARSHFRQAETRKKLGAAGGRGRAVVAATLPRGRRRAELWRPGHGAAPGSRGLGVRPPAGSADGPGACGREAAWQEPRPRLAWAPAS